MAGSAGKVKSYLAIGVAAVGILADVVGILGAVGDWGGETTTVVLGTEAAGASESTTSTDAPAVTEAPSTTQEPTTTTTVPAETPQQFLDALATAFATGDGEFAFSRLHPQVIARYGEDQCRARMTEISDPTAAFEVVAVSEPADYTWVTDSLSSVAQNTLSVDVIRTAGGTQVSVTVHITEIDGQFHWFTDCGNPV